MTREEYLLNKEHSLKRRLYDYCSPKSPMYDPVFAAEMAEYGYVIQQNGNSSESKKQIIAFVDANSRLPSPSSEDPDERKMYSRMKSYCMKNSKTYDESFLKFMILLGYKSKSIVE